MNKKCVGGSQCDHVELLVGSRQSLPSSTIHASGRHTRSPQLVGAREPGFVAGGGPGGQWDPCGRLKLPEGTAPGRAQATNSHVAIWLFWRAWGGMRPRVPRMTQSALVLLSTAQRLQLGPCTPLGSGGEAQLMRWARSLQVVTCSGRNGGLQAPDDGIWWARERCR